MKSNLSISQQYLKKIGFNQHVIPSLQNLRELLNLHIQNIPFGNLNQYLGIPIAIDSESVTRKIINQGREGYCLEQNVLTNKILTDLGYETFNLLGRVYYQNMHADTPPRTHLITIVKLDSKLHLFDPGFGGVTPTGVISLDRIGEKQETQLESFRLIDAQDSGLPLTSLTGMKIMLQIYLNDVWTNVYAFNPEHEVAETDLQLANWYVSTSPKSLFTQNLIFSIIYNNQRMSLHNGVLKIYSSEGVIKENLININDYKRVFSKFFKLNIDDHTYNLLSEKLGYS